jgi:hypothetical protein
VRGRWGARALWERPSARSLCRPRRNLRKTEATTPSWGTALCPTRRGPAAELVRIAEAFGRDESLFRPAAELVRIAESFGRDESLFRPAAELVRIAKAFGRDESLFPSFPYRSASGQNGRDSPTFHHAPVSRRSPIPVNR